MGSPSANLRSLGFLSFDLSHDAVELAGIGRRGLAGINLGLAESPLGNFLHEIKQRCDVFLLRVKLVVAHVGRLLPLTEHALPRRGGISCLDIGLRSSQRVIAAAECIGLGAGDQGLSADSFVAEGFSGSRRGRRTGLAPNSDTFSRTRRGLDRFAGT